MTCGGADLGRGGKSAEKPPTQHRDNIGGRIHSQLILNTTHIAKGQRQTTKCITDMLKVCEFE